MAVLAAATEVEFRSTEQEWKTCTVGKSCSLDRSNTCVAMNDFDSSGMTGSSIGCLPYNWC